MFPGLTGETRNETLVEMMCGIVMYGLVGQVVLLFFSKDFMQLSVGWWIGIITAMLCGYHIWWVLHQALGAEEGYVVKKVTSGSILRYLVIVFVVAIVMITEIGNPLTTVLGVLGLKAGAYLQPLVHRIIRKKKEVNT